jgi:hypothetical protein
VDGAAVAHVRGTGRRDESGCVGIYRVQTYFSGVSVYQGRKCYNLHESNVVVKISAVCELQELELQASSSSSVNATSTPTPRRRV